jgi:hypothetical protein
MFDSFGKLLHFSTNVNLQNNYKINTRSLSAGIYFIRVNSNLGEFTKKVIIQ